MDIDNTERSGARRVTLISTWSRGDVGDDGLDKDVDLMTRCRKCKWPTAFYEAKNPEYEDCDDYAWQPARDLADITDSVAILAEEYTFGQVRMYLTAHYSGHIQWRKRRINSLEEFHAFKREVADIHRQKGHRAMSAFTGRA
jgi:hypothetical protein